MMINQGGHAHKVAVLFFNTNSIVFFNERKVFFPDQQISNSINISKISISIEQSLLAASLVSQDPRGRKPRGLVLNDAAS